MHGLQSEKEAPISNLFQYTCPSCGGHLETDNSRKLMICRSCGNTYDYDYFGEENLLAAADKALADKNFTAAKDMYSFMLDKEPSNVKALRGLILATNKVTKLYDITMKIRNGSFVPGTFNLQKYSDKCDPADSKFFEEADKILSLHKEYMELNKNRKALEAEEDTEKQNINEYSGGFFYYASPEKLRLRMIIAAIVLVILGFVTFSFATDPETPSLLVLTFAILIIITVIYILAAVVQLISSLKERKNPAPSNLNDIDARMEENNDEMSRVVKEINAAFKEMNSL